MKLGKLSVFSIMIIFTALMSTQVTLSFADEDEYLQYDIPLKGLFMEYPSNWQALDENLPEPLLTTFVLEDNVNQVSASIAVMDIVLNTEISSIEATNDFVQGIKDIHPELIVQQEGNIKIDDYSSRQKIVSYPQDSGQIKQDIVITVVNNHAYVFLLSSSSTDYTKYQPIFNKFLNSVEINPETIPQLIENTYDDSGIKAKFPENWLTIKSVVNDRESDQSMNMIMSFPSSMANGGIENVAIVALGYSDNDSLGNNSYFDSIESSGCYLITDNISIVKINAMKAMEFEMICVPDGFDEEIESVGYALISEDKTLILFYMASENLYDINFQKFDEFKQTVNIENTLDLSDYDKIASVYGMTIKQEQLKITDDITLPIILYDDSMINDFNFDMENSQISFQPILNTDEFFQIDIEIEEILDEPFLVDINGEYADFFIINDNTTDKTIISVFSESPTDKVTINGKLSENLTNNLTIGDSDSIPPWIKNNAEFWAQDKIDDATFISGIQFLIKNGILDIPPTTENNLDSTSDEIPSWIKGNAEFWAQGLISDDDFLNGIQYLVQQGIIKV